MSMNTPPIGTLEVEGRKFELYTLATYSTPYYYVRELGSVQHFESLRRLKNAIKRAMKKNALRSVHP